MADGTSKLTISETILRDYYIEYVPLEIQNDYVEEYVRPYNRLEQQLVDAKKQLKQNIEDIL